MTIIKERICFGMRLFVRISGYNKIKMGICYRAVLDESRNIDVTDLIQLRKIVHRITSSCVVSVILRCRGCYNHLYFAIMW